MPLVKDKYKPFYRKVLRVFSLGMIFIGMSCVLSQAQLIPGFIQNDQTVCSVVGDPAPLTNGLSFLPTNDAYVTDIPSTDLNGVIDPTRMLVRTGGAGAYKESYITFDLSTVTAPVTSAIFNIYGRLGHELSGNVIVDVYPVPDLTWNENTIHYDNRPTATGTVLASQNIIDDMPAYYKFDLTSYVQAEFAAGRKVVSFMLSTLMPSPYSVDINSKESLTDQPMMIINETQSNCNLSYQWQYQENCVDGTSGIWTNIAGETGSTYDPPAGMTQTTCYRLFVSDDCARNDFTNHVTLTVVASPIPPGVVNGTRCETGTVDLGATGSTFSYRWYDASSGGNFLGTGTPFTTPSISATTNFYVSAIDGNSCESVRSTVTATVNTIPAAPTGVSADRCGTGTVSLSASGSPSSYNWYDASSGGTLVGTGTPFVTPSISTTTTYYVAAVDGSCESSTRTAVTATINTIPGSASAPSVNRCGTGTAELTGSGSPNTYNWYDASSGGNLLGTGNPFTTPSISTTTQFFVTAVSTEGCESVSRTSTSVNVNNPPAAVTGTTSGARCGTGTVNLSASGAPSGYKWYDASSGGTLVGTGSPFITPSISSTTIYYVAAIDGSSCESTTRVAATATITPFPSAPTGVEGGRCGTGTVSLSASGSSSDYNWYDASSGGTLVGTGSGFTTPSISTTTTYYVAAVDATCESSTRTAVTATINSIPSAPTGVDGARCGTGTVSLSASGSPSSYNWYDASSGGTLVGTGSPFTTPSISDTTIYYASSISAASCESASRTPVTANVKFVATVTTGVDTIYSCSPVVLNAVTNLDRNAIRLDGVDDYLEVPDGVYFNSDFTVQSWVYLRSYDQNAKLLDFGNGWGSDNIIVTLSRNASETVGFTIFQGASEATISSTYKLPLNQWVHLACVLSGTTGTIYFNGQVAGTGTLQAPINIFRNDCFIGKSSHPPYAYANVDLDEFRIYSFGRTQGQIQGDMDAEISAAAGGLLHYWKMGEGAGTTTACFKTGLVATFINGPTWINESSPLDITYNWSPGTGLNTASGRVVIASPVVNTLYQVTATFLSGCSASGSVRVIPTVAPDTSIYGNGKWNAYSFEGSEWNTIKGFYTETNLSFDSEDQFGRFDSPSSAADYTGCLIPPDDHSVAYKRTNIPAGTYQIDILNNDDAAYLSIDGKQKFTQAINTTPVTAWVGNLTTSSKVEFKWQEEGWDSYAALSFTTVTPPAITGGTIAGDQTFCASGDPVAFTSTAPASGCYISGYQWESSPDNTIYSDVSGAIGLTYDAGLLSATTYYRRKATDDCGRTAYSDTITVAILNPASPSITNGSRCGTGTIDLAASGSTGIYNWYDVATLGVSIGSGSPFTTPSISASTTYYVAAVDGTCEGPRVAVTATVNAIPSAPTGVDGARCGTGTVSLSASGSPSSYNWYDASSGGTLVGTGSPFTTPSISDTTIYYASSISAASCESASRTPVTANVKFVATVTTGVDTIYSCSPVVLNAVTNLDRNAIRLDGVDDYLSVPPGVYFNSDFTVQAWVYLRNYDEGAKLIDFGNGVDSDNIVVTLINQWTREVEFSIAQGSTIRKINSSYKIPLNQWVHVACVLSGTTGTIYFNGQVAAIGLLFTPNNIVRNLCYIGKSNSTQEAYANVDLDEVRFYNFGRTQGQIQGDMDTEVSLAAGGLVNYWKMNEGAGTTTTDLKSGVVATFNNGPTWISDSAPLDITYNWSPGTGLNTAAGRVVIANPVVNTLYQVTATFLGGCTASGNIRVIPPSPTDTSVYGNGQWNVYCFEGNNWDTYKGSYTETSLNFDSENKFNKWDSPSSATGYIGCAIPLNYHSVSYKRTNIPAGTYRIDILNNDDNAFLSIDGCLKFTRAYNTGSETAWIGNLTTSSKVEFRWNESGGNSQAEIVFAMSTIPAFSGGTVSGDQNFCAGSADPVAFTSTASAVGCTISGYQWESSTDNVGWSDISGATALTYDAGVLAATTYFKRKATDDCGRTAYSNTITVTVLNPASPVVTDGSRCGTGTVDLSASGSTGTYNWYDVAALGVSIGSGASFTTPSISTNTTYYVAAVDGSCESSRIAVNATINSVPSAPTGIPDFRCGTGTVNLSASGSPSSYNWYDASSAGILLGTGAAYTTPSISANTDYYVAAVDGACESTSRTIVTATVNTIPSAPTGVPASRCGSGIVSLSASGSPSSYNWYDASSGGSLVGTGAGFTTPPLVGTVDYFVASESIEGCESISRTTVTATIDVLPADPVINDTTVCGTGVVTLTASGSATGYSWYDVSSGGISIGTNSPWNTPSLTANTTYYVSAVNGSCESGRIPVAITVLPASIAGSLTSDVYQVCQNSNSGTLSLNGNSGSVIDWIYSSDNFASNSNGLSSTSLTQPFLNLTTSTYYKAIVKDGACPADTTASLMITVDPLTVPGSVIITNANEIGGVLALSGSIGSVLRWEESTDNFNTFSVINLNDPLLDFEFSSNKYYRAIVQSGVCPESASTSILIEGLRIYTSLTPNGDGVNDAWVIDGIELYTINTVKIFNRWGDLVFEESGYNNKDKVWNGEANTGIKIDDNSLPEGTYFYQVQIKDMDIKTGYVVLKR